MHQLSKILTRPGGFGSRLRGDHGIFPWAIQHQDVLRFQIPMRNAPGVRPFHRWKKDANHEWNSWMEFMQLMILDRKFQWHSWITPGLIVDSYWFNSQGRFGRCWNLEQIQKAGTSCNSFTVLLTSSNRIETSYKPVCGKQAKRNCVCEKLQKQTCNRIAWVALP